MQTKYAKKIFGTAALGLLVAAITLSGLSVAQARFIDNNNTSNVDGVVTAKDIDSLTIMNSGSEAIQMIINDDTVFTANKSFADIFIGSSINAIIKHGSGLPLAKVIKINDGNGYGQPGDHLQVHRCEIISKSANDHTLTVKTGISVSIFHINTATKFMKTSFSDLKPGDIVDIMGHDSGQDFLADHVILQK
jgi:hypothetical protein